MKTIAFFGGGSIRELGPAADVELFFECINAFAVSSFPNEDWSVLTDRLYRRYIRFEELDAAAEKMGKLFTIFQSLYASSINLRATSEPSAVTQLNVNGTTLADVFAKYFRGFDHCKEATVLFLKTWNKYLPIRIVISDLRDYAVDKARPLEDYDARDGRPFWLRHIPVSS